MKTFLLCLALVLPLIGCAPARLENVAATKLQSTISRAALLNEKTLTAAQQTASALAEKPPAVEKARVASTQAVESAKSTGQTLGTAAKQAEEAATNFDKLAERNTDLRDENDKLKSSWFSFRQKRAILIAAGVTVGLGVAFFALRFFAPGVLGNVFGFIFRRSK
jgi:hypothetical protein